ncbi:hypothetical protein EDB95_1569 [Dinghuibacter silviterrae]|uniref:Lipoprotein n=1 Tax=Dinghuibacter silviterrae TaxID=1539049 RepID=A0A4R8DQV7_9BACT|nr:hypothetical protein EDB95_1569 [Dinghuibacter silviterrae]
MRVYHQILLFLGCLLLACSCVSHRVRDVPQAMASLKDGQQVWIYYTEEGCFGSAKMKLTIKRQGDNFTARLFDLLKSPSHPLKTATLPLGATDAFQKFGREFGRKFPGYCTTYGTYKIEAPYLEVSKQDGSCGWNGFQQLCADFFGGSVDSGL